nr:hypothetical protein [Tanacetum cinerariifolium]
ALDKALYGLKQAPRAWYDVLSQFLIDIGFQKVPTPMVEQAKLKLDLVGKPVDHTDYQSMIGSLMYVTSIRPDIMFATLPTPMVEQAKLKLDLVGKPVDHTDYRSMIRSLMYVTSSRPDIMFATLNDLRSYIKVVIVIKSCVPNELDDLIVTLKRFVWYTYKVLTEGGYGKAITVGAILILHNIFMFSPKPSGHYLNITLRNIVMVFPRDSVTGNPSGVGRSGIVGITKEEISTRVGEDPHMCQRAVDVIIVLLRERNELEAELEGTYVVDEGE